MFTNIKQYRRVVKTRAKIYSDYPILYEVMNFTDMNEDLKLPTYGAVYEKREGGYRILYNPELTAKIDDDKLQGVFMHEMCHLVFDHLTTRLPEDLRRAIKEQKGTPGLAELKDKWNIATDLSVNQHLGEFFDRKNNPMQICFPEGFGQADGYSSEYYFNQLKSKTIKIQMNIKLDSHDQWQLDENEGDGMGDDGQPLTEEQKQAVKAVKKEIKEKLQEIQENMGIKIPNPNTPAGVGDSPNRIKVDLRGEIRRKTPGWMAKATKASIHGFETVIEWSRKRPNRRLGNVYPGSRKKSVQNKLLIFVDVSGSISMNLFHIFMGHIKDLRKHAEFDICFFDDNICKIMKNFRGLDIDDVPKGGGTNFEPIMNYWNENGKQYDAMFIFTDGSASYSTPPNRESRVNWILYGSDQACKHGRIYHIAMEDGK